jgi:hypothetical protein
MKLTNWYREVIFAKYIHLKAIFISFKDFLPEMNLSAN